MYPNWWPAFGNDTSRGIDLSQINIVITFQGLRRKNTICQTNHSGKSWQLRGKGVKTRAPTERIHLLPGEKVRERKVECLKSCFWCPDKCPSINLRSGWTRAYRVTSSFGPKSRKSNQTIEGVNYSEIKGFFCTYPLKNQTKKMLLWRALKLKRSSFESSFGLPFPRLLYQILTWSSVS